MVGTVSFVNLNSALTCQTANVDNPQCWNLHYSNNPGLGQGGSGGTCFGDSGGPVLDAGQIVAVNSFVLNYNCNGAGFGYRVDTALVYAFLASFGYTA
jgi:Trypsin